MENVAKERGIAFNGEMVKALLDDRKTQTRRLAKWKPREEGLNLGFSGLQLGHYFTGRPESGHVLRSRDGHGTWNDRTYPLHCVYGKPGDRLWVKEALRCDEQGMFYAADGRRIANVPDDFQDVVYEVAAAMFMPRWASRITLEITGVRVERLWGISDRDIKAEGIGEFTTEVRYSAFKEAWDRIHRNKNPWDSNPWVWVIEFKKIGSVR